jgi:transketolase
MAPPDDVTSAAEAPLATSHKDMANALRALAMDAVQAANSGHPGMPMGMADVATVLFRSFLNFDAERPDWPDRDRFVLSAGHGSMLLYGLLHLTGYPDLTMDEIRNFRQLGSRTAGHPEYGAAPGIETTTGPLGQGMATAVGMALAERSLAAQFGGDLVDHWIYVIAGDGCLMEGISHEAASLAGHLRLGKLIVLFDDNQISIDGATDLSVSDDQLGRFAAYGWHTQRIDGHDPAAIEAAIEAARAADQPSLIACRTIIGYGAPNKQGTAATHGQALGKDEVAATRDALGWDYAPFVVPGDVLEAWRASGERGRAAARNWDARLAGRDAGTVAEWSRRQAGALPPGLAGALSEYKKRIANEEPGWSTRQASQNVLEVINECVPETIGGSADLTGSNNTKTADLSIFTASSPDGRYVHYGVREHAMGAAMNGIALHGGLIPYGGTFLVFTDYLRPALRLAALMEQRVVHVMTHDSIGLGEDGPTHQPVEHLASLRAMPGVLLFRPGDAVETAECWDAALQAMGPSVLALSRQGLPAFRRGHRDENLCAKGAYEVAAADGEARVSLLSTGSEVSVALDARALLQADGIATRVVSMPCWELFDDQDAAYRKAVLGPGTVRVAVEAAAGFGWERYVGADGGIVAMTGFGASAPAADLYVHFGITAGAVAGEARSRL